MEATDIPTEPQPLPKGKTVVSVPLTRANIVVPISVTSKKSPNVCKSCPKMISLEK